VECYDFNFMGRSLKVTISLGVTFFNDITVQGVTPEVALKEADSALYRAKTNGRNRVESYSGSKEVA